MSRAEWYNPEYVEPDEDTSQYPQNEEEDIWGTGDPAWLVDLINELEAKREQPT